MIPTTRMLKEAIGDKDTFVTVYINGREYMIDHFRSKPDSFDELSTYIQLVCTDCETGNLRR